MRRKLTLITAVLCGMVLSSCNTFPGSVRLMKNESGEWEATEVIMTDEDITPDEIKAMEDELNGR